MRQAEAGKMEKALAVWLVDGEKSTWARVFIAPKSLAWRGLAGALGAGLLGSGRCGLVVAALLIH
jgi:hypothetical protein